jgi:hypothetical protein
MRTVTIKYKYHETFSGLCQHTKLLHLAIELIDDVTNALYRIPITLFQLELNEKVSKQLIRLRR